jgi:hypothetical protein
LLGEERRDRLSDRRPDPAHLADRFCARLHQRVHRAEPPRQQLGRALADVADAEREEQGGERPLLRGLDRVTSSGRFLANPSSPCSRSGFTRLMS